jgi:acyl dehydratase
MTDPEPESLPIRRVRQRGLYYEELEQGVIYEHRPGRTIGEGDNSLFTTLTMNPAALHLDEHESRSGEFGARVVNSMLTLSTLVGLSVGQLTLGTTVANLGFSDVAFPQPVLLGDTLYAESEVIEKRSSESRPANGLVVFEHRARNQDGEIVAIARRTALMKRLPAER